MKRSTLLLVLAAGCGRWQFERRAPDAESGVDGGIDAADAATIDCWPAWRSGSPSFTAPAPVLELAHADREGNPWLTADALTLYFDSGPGGQTEIYRASRPFRDQPFAPRVAVAELTSPLEDTGLVLTPDQLHGVMASSRLPSAGFDLWTVDRPGLGAPFGTPTQASVTAINDGNNQFDAYLTSDGLRLYYATSLAPGQALRMSSRGSIVASFTAPSPIPGTQTFQVEGDPDLSPDELVLVFSAMTPLRLYMASRASTALAFGPPTPLTAISTTGHDADPAVSADGCELFFISDRGGNRDLWRTTVVP